MNKEDLDKERFKLHQALCERNETIDELQQRIDKAIEYIEKVKTLAQIDKVCILSISTLENILKGSEK